MKKLILALFLLFIALPVSAQASDNGGINYGHKVGHFAVGFGVAWGCGLAGHHKTGLAIGIGLGLAKEYHDNRYGETWVSQRRDIIITSAGALLGYAISKHYYPEGYDFSPDHTLDHMTLYEREQYDVKAQAEFKAWEVQHARD